MRIAVLGPGGVGGFVAAALARAGEPVTVVARESTVDIVAHQGIRVSSVRLGEFVAHPVAAARLEEPVDVLVVAPKATALEESLGRIGVAPGLVVPLLNGRDHVEWLREHLSAPVAVGSIRIEADRPEPGVIVHTSPFLRIDLGSDDPGLRGRLEGLAEVLSAAEIPAQVLDSEAQVVWSKLVRLNALALTTSAADRPLGFIREDPVRRGQLERAVDEAAAVARAEGARLDRATVMAELEDAHASLGSSMQRDIAAGRAPELDAIAGAVLRAAARHGLAAPTVAALAEEVALRAGVPVPHA